jgi:dolichyl-phosphate-mannose-protein mannosyltransferase
LQRTRLILLGGWLALGVCIRLIGISQPFADTWSWRQADVAMIAENFYRHGYNIFYPQINWAGPHPGYVGTEFPLVPLIASLFYNLFGIHAWIGRAVSVLFFLVSQIFLFLLVSKTSQVRTAFLATGIYTLIPLSIFAGRCFMPDMTSLTFSIAALYFVAEWLEHPQRWGVFIAALLATNLTILVKLPAIIIGLPLLYMVWERYGGKFLWNKAVWAYAALSLACPLAWYLHAYVISISYYPYHMFGEGLLHLVTADQYLAIVQQTALSGLTPLVAVLLLVGLFVPSHLPFGWLFHWWLAAHVIFIIAAGEGHARHEWYGLALVPAAAALSGTALGFLLSLLERLCRAWAALATTCVIFFAGLAYTAYLYVSPSYALSAGALLATGQELRRLTLPSALVIVADWGNPTALYYSQRKGWHFLAQFGKMPADSAEATTELEALRQQGANYIAFTRYLLYWLDTYVAFHTYLDTSYRRVKETRHYVIFDLAGTGDDKRGEKE